MAANDKKLARHHALDGMCLTVQSMGDSLTKRVGEKWGNQTPFLRKSADTTPSTNPVEDML
jgi:hypothetical protein